MSLYGIQCSLGDGTVIFDTSVYGVAFLGASNTGNVNLSIDYTSAPNSFSQVEWVECGYYQSFNPGGESTQTFQNRCLQLAITGSPNNFTNSDFGNKWSDVGLSDYAQLNVSPVYSNGHVSRLNSSTSVITRKMILTLENNQWLTV